MANDRQGARRRRKVLSRKLPLQSLCVCVCVQVRREYVRGFGVKLIFSVELDSETFYLRIFFLGCALFRRRRLAVLYWVGSLRCERRRVLFCWEKY